MFNGRITSKRSDFVWSPRFPDLSPLAFLLWGYCKENVYTNMPQSVPELQRSIEDFGHNIPSATWERSLPTSSAGLLNTSPEMEIILSTESSFSYVIRKCKINLQIFYLFCRYIYANVLLSLKLWNELCFCWAPWIKNSCNFFTHSIFL